LEVCGNALDIALVRFIPRKQFEASGIYITNKMAAQMLYLEHAIRIAPQPRHNNWNFPIRKPSHNSFAKIHNEIENFDHHA